MPRIFDHDEFYGRLQLQRALPGLTLAHRLADGPPDSVERHTHLDAHFVLVTSGAYISTARGEATNRFPLIYNPPGTTHRDRFRNGTGSFFTISVAAGHFRELVNKTWKSASYLTDSHSTWLARALLWKSTRRDRRCNLDLEFLSHQLLDSVRQPGSVLTGQEGHKCAPHWLRRVHEKLEDEYPQQPTIRQLASAAGVHPVHLARTFRVFLGCTPGQLIQLRRLERTADLLLFSTMCLADIAFACGFADQSHMTNSFRRIYGMAPGKFRKTACRQGPFSGQHVSFLQDVRKRLRARSLP